MAEAAFESVTTRFAWYAAEAIAKYDAVMTGTDGRLRKSDGTRPFVGICMYPAEAANVMATVVRGIFPGILTEDATKGSLVTVNGAAAGKFKIAGVGDKVYGTLIADAIAGNLAAIIMVETGVIGFASSAAVPTGTLSGSVTEYIAATTTIALASATEGATIKYRFGTSGDYSTYSSALATTGKSGDIVIQAYATKTGVADSAVATLTFEQAQVAAVTFDPATGGEYEAGTTTITLASATGSATIKYRLGTEGEYSTYSAPLATTAWTDAEVVVQAYATKTGYADAASTSATYTPAS